MIRIHIALLLSLSFVLSNAQAWETEELVADDLDYNVEVLVDEWGVPHIYAKSEHDLFFAQGFCAARDRLFQFEMWRRQATGTVAELLGSRELKRDIGTRLFRFRGDMQQEMAHYHANGVKIIEAFTAGVNAYIAYTREHPEVLPIEFDLLQTEPQFWTPDVVISRHQGLLGNIGQELNIARVLRALGEEKTRELFWFHPKRPNLNLHPLVDSVLLEQKILDLYQAYRQPVRFRPEDVVAAAANDLENYRYLAQEKALDDAANATKSLSTYGSNNWVVAGDHTESGSPILANDPHRTLAVPSLRYMAHLVAPGWDVIGGGEPEIPGISIGHNGKGAWGLTVFRTDAEDLYVYELNPRHPNQYRYQGAWVDMTLEHDTIPVKGRSAYPVELKYTVHGPVVYHDTERNLACAVRCGWLEVGGSPYLASLRMDQAENFKEFREACSYSHIPGENMIWGDARGNIGWQAVGIAPVRSTSSGLIPVPGDGSVEWDGYLPIPQLPNIENPQNGMIITANEHVTPDNYEHWNAIGYNWADPYRGMRLKELLTSKEKHSVADMARYQTDYLSLPARALVPLLKKFAFPDSLSEVARQRLSRWDLVMNANSVAAGIYAAWEAEIHQSITHRMVPLELQDKVRPQMSRALEYLFKNGIEHPSVQRTAMSSFLRAVSNLANKFGPDVSKWQYGQEAHKHVYIQHPLSAAVNEQFRAMLNAGPAIRGGGAYTPGMTSANLNQRSGATFRLIVDTGNWDNSLAMNAPGQSGNPMSNHYRDLFDRWANDELFQLCYTRTAVEEHTTFRLVLKPSR